MSLPSTAAYVPPNNSRYPDYVPVPPSTQGLPAQEPGVRPARPVPYELHVLEEADPADNTVKLHFGNTGRAAAVFQVRSGNNNDGPWTFTVGSHDHVSETWTYSDQNTYDLSVYGPNGFLRAYRGSLAGKHRANLTLKAAYSPDREVITLEIHNRGAAFAKLRIFDAYTKETIDHFLQAGETLTRHWPLESSFGWYDFTIEVASDPSFRQRIAGHVETGDDSMTDPAIG